MPRRPTTRVERAVMAGAWSARHWRGLLLALWGALFAIVVLIAWAGYANRDDVFGGAVMTLFGLVAIAMLLRFPKRLVRSMWRARSGSRAGLEERAGDPVIDAEGVVKPRPSRPLPSRPPRRP